MQLAGKDYRNLFCITFIIMGPSYHSVIALEMEQQGTRSSAVLHIYWKSYGQGWTCNVNAANMPKQYQGLHVRSFELRLMAQTQRFLTLPATDRTAMGYRPQDCTIFLLLASPLDMSMRYACDDSCNFNELQHHIVFQQILIMCHILVYLGSCVQMLREHLLYSFFYQCSLCLWWKSKLFAIFWQSCVVRPKHVHSDHCKCPINVYSVFKLNKISHTYPST